MSATKLEIHQAIKSVINNEMGRPMPDNFKPDGGVRTAIEKMIRDKFPVGGLNLNDLSVSQIIDKVHKALIQLNQPL